jgi:signal peptidase I
MIRSRLPLLLLVPLVMVLSSCGIATDRLVSAALGKEVYRTPSESMEPTIKKNSLVTARKVRGDYAPKIGDIVVFNAPEWGVDGSMIKRVIGVPGSVVQCCDADGRQLLNGRPMDESYLRPGDRQQPFGPVTIPAGRLWLEGDHRSISLDSRYRREKPGNGTVAVSGVIGVVELDGSEPE